jgi:hypothetical protein
MLLGLSLFDPLGGIGQDIVGWIGHSISQGIGGFASWAIGGVIHAMQATTTPDFTSWFKGPWRAMLTVVAWLSVPILFIGVGTAALRGDLTAVLKRGLGAPVIMAIGTAVALPVTAGILPVAASWSTRRSGATRDSGRASATCPTSPYRPPSPPAAADCPGWRRP